jgi:regulator of cell morphogenesis and NO signaling
MQQDLLAHMQKEEAILFPMLLAGGNPFVSQPIAMMRAEHIHHGATLERLSELTHNATPPGGACNTWRALYAGIAQLQEDLVNHIDLENNVLFAQFDTAPAPSHSPCCGSCGG